MRNGTRGYRRADARALLFFAGVGRTGRQAGDGQRQAARRDEGLGPLIDQPGIDQRVGHGLLQILGGATLHARRDFFGEEFEEKFRHPGTTRAVF